MRISATMPATLGCLLLSFCVGGAGCSRSRTYESVSSAQHPVGITVTVSGRTATLACHTSDGSLLGNAMALVVDSRTQKGSSNMLFGKPGTTFKSLPDGEYDAWVSVMEFGGGQAGSRPVSGTVHFAIPCAPKRAADEIDFGSVKNSVYRNKQFGLTVTLPSGWIVRDHEALMAASKGDSAPVKPLFSAAKNSSSPASAGNAAMVCWVAPVRQMPEVKRGKDYLNLCLKKELPREARILSEPSTESVGGREFDVMRCEVSLPSMTVRNDNYACTMKGHVMLFSLVYATEEDGMALQDILRYVTIR